MENKLEIKIDGGFNNLDADNYVGRCKAGAINLNLYQLGNYSWCYGCKDKKECEESAHTAGEQAEL